MTMLPAVLPSGAAVEMLKCSQLADQLLTDDLRKRHSMLPPQEQSQLSHVHPPGLMPLN